MSLKYTYLKLLRRLPRRVDYRPILPSKAGYCFACEAITELCWVRTVHSSKLLSSDCVCDRCKAIYWRIRCCNAVRLLRQERL